MAFLNITELPVVQGVDCQNIMFILLYPCIQLVYNRTEFPDFVRPLKPPAPLPYFFADNLLISTVLSVYFPPFMTENPHGRGCGFKSRHGIICPIYNKFYIFQFSLFAAQQHCPLFNEFLLFRPALFFPDFPFPGKFRIFRNSP